MKKTSVRKIIYLFLLIFVLIFTPQAFALPHQISNKAIILAIGIDKADTQYEVSAQLLVPKNQKGFSENYSIISAFGNTISLALNKLELNIGKQLGLAHTNMIILSASLDEEENIFSIFDFFIRDRELGNYALIMHTDKTAKELLQLTTDVNESSVNSLQEIVILNDRYIYGVDSTLNNFINGYFSPSKTGQIADITVISESEDSTSGISSLSDNSQSSGDGGQSSGNSELPISQSSENSQNKRPASKNSSNTQSSQQASSSAETDSSSGSQSSQTKGQFENDGSTIIYKEGKKVATFNSYEYRGINWISDTYAKKGFVELYDVNDEYLTDADIVVNIYDRKVNKQYNFIEGKPVMKCKITLTVSLKQIIQSSYDGLLGTDSYYNLSNSIKEELRVLVQREVQESLALLKEYNIDLVKVYENYYKYKPKKWKEYLNNVDDDENYMQDLLILTEVVINEFN